mmetsp:Transcript_9609/g.14475  ORF Transcript_9609/g.14475 Transcript_9609/m.14475 type:complete len:286 (+) Transcript_9609:7-864(+)
MVCATFHPLFFFLFSFLFYTSIGLASSNAVTSVGQGNCQPFSLNHNQQMCLGYQITKTTNVSAWIDSASGALSYGFWANGQPNCNNFASITQVSTVYPGTNKIHNEFKTSQPTFGGLLLGCLSINSCSGVVCMSFSPFLQTTTFSPMINLVRTQSNPVLPKPTPPLPNIGATTASSGGYVSFAIVASIGQSGKNCYSWPVWNSPSPIALACNSAPQMITLYSSDQVVGSLLWFEGCSGSSVAHFKVDSSDSFGVPLTPQSYNSTTIGGLYCRRTYFAQVLSVQVN